MKKRVNATPGPWKIEDRLTNATLSHAIEGTNRRLIAWTLRHYDRDEQNKKTSAIDDADARLIAAAPDLLEALSEIAIETGHANPSEWMRKRALAAITKAEGGEK